MPTNILMPALSPTMEKGNLAKWLKKEGDVIKAGDIIAEIETDKATMEVEAVDEGTLAKIVIPEGTADVPVNNVIGLIASEGEDVKTVAAGSASGGGAAPPSATGPAEAAAVPSGLLKEPAHPEGATGMELRRLRASRTGRGYSPRPWPGGSPRMVASRYRAQGIRPARTDRRARRPRRIGRRSKACCGRGARTGRCSAIVTETRRCSEGR